MDIDTFDGPKGPKLERKGKMAKKTIQEIRQEIVDGITRREKYIEKLTTEGKTEKIARVQAQIMDIQTLLRGCDGLITHDGGPRNDDEVKFLDVYQDQIDFGGTIRPVRPIGQPDGGIF
jgi:hypothetical protein